MNARAVGCLFVSCLLALVVNTSAVVVTALSDSDIQPMAAPFVEEAIIACVATGFGTEIKTGSGQTHYGCECYPPSTTVIHYADDGVTTSSAGFALGAGSRNWFIAAPGGQCLSSSGTVNVPCNCLVAMEP